MDVGTTSDRETPDRRTNMTADYDLDTDEDATQEGAAELAITLDQFDICKHDCVVTLTSPRTGDHRTFKIATVREGKGEDKTKGGLAGKRIVSLLVGPDNVNDFSGFAFVNDGGIVKVWSRLRGNGVLSDYEKFADLLTNPNYWASRGVTYQFSLRCTRCGRPLTHPSSLISGMGPICEGR